jgi:hypothetical protein
MNPQTTAILLYKKTPHITQETKKIQRHGVSIEERSKFQLISTRFLIFGTNRNNGLEKLHITVST